MCVIHIHTRSAHIRSELETVCMCLLSERFSLCVTAVAAIFISFHEDGVFLSFSLFDAGSFAHSPDCCCQSDDFIELIALTHGMSALAAARVLVLVSLSVCVVDTSHLHSHTQPEMSKQNIKTPKILFLIRLLSVNVVQFEFAKHFLVNFNCIQRMI